MWKKEISIIFIIMIAVIFLFTPKSVLGLELAVINNPESVVVCQVTASIFEIINSEPWAKMERIDSETGEYREMDLLISKATLTPLGYLLIVKPVERITVGDRLRVFAWVKYNPPWQAMPIYLVHTTTPYGF